jgi:serine acetyltransferase
MGEESQLERHLHLDALDRTPAWSGLRADLGRYLEPSWSMRRKLRALLTSEGAWLALLYRTGTWIYFECPSPLAARLLKLIWKPADLLLSGLLDVHLSPACRIGPGFYIGHHGGVWINPEARLGASCNIAQGVIIGVAGARSGGRAPVIGDRVWIGPHAVVTGNARVGDEAVFGITWFAQDALGEIVYADLPSEGETVAAGTLVPRVVRAIRDAHPYEEPVVAVLPQRGGGPATLARRSAMASLRRTPRKSCGQERAEIYSGVGEMGLEFAAVL